MSVVRRGYFLLLFFLDQAQLVGALGMTELEKDGETALAEELRKRIAEKPSERTQAAQP